MGLTIRKQKNVKFVVVDSEDNKYYTSYELEEGTNNIGEIFLSLLTSFVFSNKNFLVNAYMIVIPVHRDLPNKNVGDIEINIVLLEGGRKEVEMKSSVCCDWHLEDMATIKYDGKQHGLIVAWVKHWKRSLKGGTLDTHYFFSRRTLKLIMIGGGGRQITTPFLF